MCCMQEADVIKIAACIERGGGGILNAGCGAGKKEMEKEIIMLEDQFPDAAKGVAEFSTPLAHQIIAGVLLSAAT